MANIRFNQDTSLNTDGQTAADQPQGQVILKYTFLILSKNNKLRL